MISQNRMCEDRPRVLQQCCTRRANSTSGVCTACKAGKQVGGCKVGLPPRSAVLHEGQEGRHTLGASRQTGLWWAERGEGTTSPGRQESDQNSAVKPQLASATRPNTQTTWSSQQHYKNASSKFSTAAKVDVPSSTRSATLIPVCSHTYRLRGDIHSSVRPRHKEGGTDTVHNAASSKATNNSSKLCTSSTNRVRQGSMRSWRVLFHPHERGTIPTQSTTVRV